MGTSQSVESKLENQLAFVKGEIKPKKLRSLHQQVLFEYPFLANIFESVLITDNRLPDCPIVYCNDLFEQMTLYPKEEIIGKNCRFLQGPDTDLEVVKSIRNAVDKGLELEVEILNYRKDGIPFYNVFLMLPIHASKKTKGPVHYFIAIQKDITIFRQPGTNPESWTKAEVAMWFYHNGLSNFISAFLQNNIDGKQLYELNEASVDRIYPKASYSERRILLTKVTELIDAPSNSFSLSKRKNNNDSFKYNADTMKENVKIGEIVDKKAMRSYWRYFSNSSSLDKMPEQSEGEIVGSSKKSNHSDNFITVKVFFRKQIKIIHIVRTITFDLLVEKLEELTNFPVKSRYKDLDGEWVLLEDDDSVEAAILCASGRTISIKVSKRFRPLSQEKQLYLNATPVSLIVVDSTSKVIFLNFCAQKMLQLEPHEYLRTKLSECIGSIDFSIVDKPQNFIGVNKETYQAIVAKDQIEFNRVIYVSHV